MDIQMPDSLRSSWLGQQHLRRSAARADSVPANFVAHHDAKCFYVRLALRRGEAGAALCVEGTNDSRWRLATVHDDEWADIALIATTRKLGRAVAMVVAFREFTQNGEDVPSFPAVVLEVVTIWSAALGIALACHPVRAVAWIAMAAGGYCNVVVPADRGGGSVWIPLDGVSTEGSASIAALRETFPDAAPSLLWRAAQLAPAVIPQEFT